MPNRPVVNAGVPYCSGLLINYEIANKVKVSKGYIRDSTNITDLFLENDTILDPVGNGQGVNGIDIGTAAVDQTHYIFVIGDSTKKEVTATLMSLSSDSPLLPFGYDSWNRIGFTKGVGGVIFSPFSSRGDGLNRDIFYDDWFASSYKVVSSGAATTFTSFDSSAFLPSSLCSSMHFGVSVRSVAAINSFWARHSASVAADGDFIASQDITTLGVTYYLSLANFNNSGTAEYKVSVENCDIHIKGFSYSVGI